MSFSVTNVLLNQFVLLSQRDYISTVRCMTHANDQKSVPFICRAEEQKYMQSFLEEASHVMLIT
jgi:hypothetical protein